MKNIKRIKKSLIQLKKLLKPIYISLINNYSISYFNINSQYVYFQINNIYCLILSEKKNINYICEIKNLFNYCVKLYTQYINCGNSYLHMNDNYTLEYICFSNCENKNNINYLAESLDIFKQLNIIINNTIKCLNDSNK